MAILVCSPNKLSLEPKPSCLALKRVKLYDEKSLDIFSVKREFPDDSLYSPNKPSLERKPNRLSLKKKLYDEDDLNLPVEREHAEDAMSEDDIKLENKDEIKLENYSNIQNELINLGLPNCGNTCYLNSIVQVLRYTPDFMLKMHSVLSSHKQLNQICTTEDEKNEQFFYKLHMLYMTMLKQEAFLKSEIGIDMSAFLFQNLESFLSSLRNISCSFEEGEQHDAHELLFTILSTFKAFCDDVKNVLSNYLENSENSFSDKDETFNHNTANTTQGKQQRINLRLKRKRKIKNEVTESVSLPFYDDTASDLGFEGTMKHVIKCLECEKKSEMTESFTNMEVSIVDEYIVEGTINLRECLEQKTVLNGENKYFCEECYQRNEAVSSYHIVSPPSILLLHCSWLRQSSNMTDIEKDTTKILIPLFLRTSENPHIFCCDSDEIYSLYAIILHLGSSSEVGHYVAFIKNASKTPEMAEVMSEYNNFFSNNCCATEEILNYKLFSSTGNNWLLFDDNEVSTFYVDETSEIFPYFEYLEINASPCMMFYFKI